MEKIIKKIAVCALIALSILSIVRAEEKPLDPKGDVRKLRAVL